MKLGGPLKEKCITVVLGPFNLFRKDFGPATSLFWRPLFSMSGSSSLFLFTTVSSAGVPDSSVTLVFLFGAAMVYYWGYPATIKTRNYVLLNWKYSLQLQTYCKSCGNLTKFKASYKDLHNSILRSRNNATTVKRRFQISLKQDVYDSG